MTGSMLIPNDQGSQTFLVIAPLYPDPTPIATAVPSENSLQLARAELKRQKASPSIREGNVKFLEGWIRIFLSSSEKPVTPVTLVNSVTSVTQLVPEIAPRIPTTVTPPNKTSVRLAGEPWEEDKFLKIKGEKVDASA